MTVGELIEKLEDYGDHLEVKVLLDETLKYGQYQIRDVTSGRDHENGGVAIAEIEI